MATRRLKFPTTYSKSLELNFRKRIVMLIFPLKMLSKTIAKQNGPPALLQKPK